MQLNRFKLEWECRRGMRELDELIMPFYKNHFDSLDEAQQQTFIELLGYSDPELFSWFMLQKQAPTDALKAMVQLIRHKVL